MLPGKGGGLLCREKDGKYYAATGSKGYRWLEAEMVKTLGLEEFIDRGYYNSLVDDAVDDISKYGDFEWFVSDSSVSLEEDTNPIGFDEIPPGDIAPWDCPRDKDPSFDCKTCLNVATCNDLPF